MCCCGCGACRGGSPSLSDTTLYPYTVRNTASDALEVRAIIAWLTYFKWQSYALIFSDDSYGRDVVQEFRRLRGDAGVLEQGIPASGPTPTSL